MEQAILALMRKFNIGERAAIDLALKIHPPRTVDIPVPHKDASGADIIPLSRSTVRKMEGPYEDSTGTHRIPVGADPVRRTPANPRYLQPPPGAAKNWTPEDYSVGEGYNPNDWVVQERDLGIRPDGPREPMLLGGKNPSSGYPDYNQLLPNANPSDGTTKTMPVGNGGAIAAHLMKQYRLSEHEALAAANEVMSLTREPMNYSAPNLAAKRWEAEHYPPPEETETWWGAPIRPTGPRPPAPVIPYGGYPYSPSSDAGDE